jgi:flagellar M-ring protein FliF
VDFINKALAQLGELFRSMTPAARITAGMLLVVIVISITYLFNHQFSSGDAYLFGGEAVSASEIGPMQAAFGKANLNDAEFDGNRIRVPSGKQAAYMAALADAGALPHNFGDVMKRMLDTSNFMVSKAKQQEMTKLGYELELKDIICKMRGIEAASVVYDVQNQMGLNAQKTITASVQVKPQGNLALTSEQVKMIRCTVSGALAGLAPESVSVIDLNGRAYPGGPAGNSPDASDDPYLSRKTQYEQQFTESITNMLSFVKGAVVTVNVELHPEIDDVENTTRIDPKAVPIDVSENNQSLNSSSAPTGGRPGLGGQGLNAPATLSGANGSRTEDERNIRRERSLTGSESRQIRKAGLTPRHVTVSVGVPTSYFEEVWRSRNPSPPGTPAKKPDAAALTQIKDEVTTDIEKHVMQVLPASEEPSKEVTKLVKVTSFATLPVAEIEKPSTADHAMVWFSDHASSVGLGLLGFFSLLMVRSIVRSVPAPVASISEPELKVAATPVDEMAESDVSGGEVSQPRLRRRRTKGGPSLRDELVEIVREDPDAAANILRNWIGSAN